MSEAELRQRPAPRSESDDSPSSRKTRKEEKEEEKKKKKEKKKTWKDEDDSGISFADIIRVLVTLVIASCGLSYYLTSSQSLLWGQRPWFTRPEVLMRYLRGPLYLTPEQLSLYNGTDPSLPIYLAVNGTIFDVSANRAMYGPGGSYNFFTGRDATRAFVTGCFQEDLTPDLDGVEEMFIPVDDEEEDRKLSSRERKIRRERETREAKAKVRAQVQHWENFFRNHKKYFEVGKVVGAKPKAPGEGKRELCEAAKRNRPKRGQNNNDGDK